MADVLNNVSVNVPAVVEPVGFATPRGVAEPLGASNQNLNAVRVTLPRKAIRHETITKKRLEPVGDTSTDYGTLGVSVYHLREVFLKRVCNAKTAEGEKLSRSSRIYEIEDLKKSPGVIRKASRDYVCLLDGKAGSSYVHTLKGPNHVGKANYMLSYSWGYTIGDIVDTLEGYCKKKKLSYKNIYVWICCLCVNQHRVVQRWEEGESVPFETFEQVFCQRVTGIKNILAMMTPWNEPGYLTRVWCIFEFYTAITNGCMVDIVMPTADHESLTKAILESNTGNLHTSVVCKNIHNIQSALGKTKIENAKASQEDDKVNILGIVKKNTGFHEFNVVVNDTIRIWMDSIFLDMLETGDATKGLESPFLQSQNADWACRLLGGKHPSSCEKELKLIRLWNQVGTVVQATGKNDKAIELHAKAAELSCSTFGERHSLTGLSYRNLGVALFGKGDFSAAIEAFEKASAITDLHYRDKHDELSMLISLELAEPRDARLYSYMGLAFGKLGKGQQCLKFHKKSLHMNTTQHGKLSLPVAENLGNLGVAEMEHGHPLMARKYLDKAKIVLKENMKSPVESHIANATIYRDIATHRLEDKKYMEAWQMFSKALLTTESVLGVDHLTTAALYESIGDVAKALGQKEGARERYLKCLEIREAQLPQHDPSINDIRIKIQSVCDGVDDVETGMDGLRPVPPDAPASGIWIRFKYIGRETYKSFLMLFCFMLTFPITTIFSPCVLLIFCCPIDERDGYMTPSGVIYDENGRNLGKRRLVSPDQNHWDL